MKGEKKHGFDTIAPMYDRLAGMVYGKSIRAAQLHFLSEIKDRSKVLVLGGGTGWLLLALLEKTVDCEVWYIDASQTMLELTRKKMVTNPSASVHLIHGTSESIPHDVLFDVVIANFYLDMFSPVSLERILRLIGNALSPRGMLLVSDFTQGQVWWQRALRFFMYRFFVWTCGIEATHLPDWQGCVNRAGFEAEKAGYFYGSFIQSLLYRFPAEPGIKNP